MVDDNLLYITKIKNLPRSYAYEQLGRENKK